MPDILRSVPYNSDFDPKKNHLQVLFKPGFSNQTREFIEAQTALQHQISSFAGHVFTNGSVVSGGRVFRKSLRWFRLLPTYDGTNVDATQWLDKRIYSIDDADNPEPTSGLVVAVADRTDTDPPTLYVEFPGESIPGGFVAGRRLRVDGSGLTAQLEAVDATYSGTAIFLGVDSGIYFIEGRFVYVESQRIIAKKYDPSPTGVFGLEYEWGTVTSDMDPSLLDSSREGGNWSAPGADRLTITIQAKFYDPSVDVIPPSYVQLMTLEYGSVKTIEKGPNYSDIGVEMARRTFDESGNYTVGSPFRMTTDDDFGSKVSTITHTGPALAHIAEVKTAARHGMKVGQNIRVSGATGPDASIYNGDFVILSVTDEFRFTYSLASVPANDAIGDPIVIENRDAFVGVIGVGKAYIQGYEIESVSNTNVMIERARDTAVVQNYNTAVSYGSYLDGTMTAGSIYLLDATHLTPIQLKNAGGTTIGSARIRQFKLVSGAPSSVSAVWRVYLYDIVIASTYKFEDVRRVVDQTTGGSLTVTLTGGVCVLKASDQSRLLLPVPQTFVKTTQPGGVSDTNYEYAKKFSAAVSGGGVTFNLTGTDRFIGPVGSNFAGSDLFNQNYVIFDNAGGVIVPTSAIIAAGAQQITLLIGGTPTVNLVANVQRGQAVPKSKSVTTQVIILTYSNSTFRYSLSITDVFEIVSAVSGSVNVAPYLTLDTGQRDDFYDHSAVTLKSVLPGVANGASITVTVRRFTHTGSTFFSADSYSGIDYATIPTYRSAVTGTSYRLADCLDFRPVRADLGTTHGNAAVVHIDSQVTADIEFYLPRRDRIVLTRQGEFKAIKGTPSLFPVLPDEPRDAMTLYELRLAPYTINAVNDVQLEYVENKNWTMPELGRQVRRIDRLEYQTALSLLEMNTASAEVVDQNGLDRFKNGFIVDAFTGHSVGDVFNPDYRCSIDPKLRELRPAFVPGNVPLKYSAASSSARQTGNENSGYVITLPYTEVPYLGHPFASTFESVNPYLVYTFKGSMICNPPSDDWVDTTIAPAVNVDLSGDSDAWNFLASAVNSGLAPGFGTQWNDWETTWSGSVVDTGFFTSSTSTASSIRRGTQSSLGFTNSSTSLGAKVIDVNLAHFMRQVVLSFAASNMRPNTDLHMFIDERKMNSGVTPNAAHVPVGEGCIRTDANGWCQGMLVIPGGIFRTGERIFTLLDETNKVEANATTVAKFVFASSGLIQTKQDTIVSTRTPVLTTQAVQETVTSSTTVILANANAAVNPAVAEPEVDLRDWGGRDGGGGDDPLAQSFLVSPDAFPYGLMLSSVSLFFKRKPTSSLPVWIEVRPMVNGYPHSSKILPFSVVTLNPNQVNIPAQTDQIASIRNTPTKFSFPSPVYLEPNTEYCVVVLSRDPEYEIYLSELGGTLYGTGEVIGQTNLGSLFKSQNGRTWTASQEFDMMMLIERCSFDTSATATVVCNTVANQSTRINLFNHNASILEFGAQTSVTHEYKIRDLATGVVSPSWTGFRTQMNTVLPNEGIADTADSVLVRTTMKTTREEIAPLFDMARNSMTTVRNLINNYGLISSGLIFVDAGAGYVTAPTLTVSGGGGTGAVLQAVITGGKVTGINIINPGEGYTSAPTIGVSGGTPTTPAVIAYSGFETGSSGGNSLSRYVQRRVTLAEDFETNYVEVTADVNRPVGTAVDAYIKYISADDPAGLDSRPWVKMVQTSGATKFSGSDSQFIECKWAPDGNSLAYTSGGVTHPRVKTFAIKLVPRSSNTSVVPRIRDFRAISAVP